MWTPFLLKCCFEALGGVFLFIYFYLFIYFLFIFKFIISASTVDYYKVDKEDIVAGDTTETAPPALPPVAQTLPSQPLDVVFIERRGNNCNHCKYTERKL